MGSSPSKLEKAMGSSFPENERFFGLENFGNTCYCNSVLQALYACQPFRQHCLEYASAGGGRPGTANGGKRKDKEEEHLLGCLSSLFSNISHHKRKTGVMAPKKFVTKLRKENELFRGYMHQDAQEFLNYLLNVCGELLEGELKQAAEMGIDGNGGDNGAQQQGNGKGKKGKKGKKNKDKGKDKTDGPAEARDANGMAGNDLGIEAVPANTTTTGQGETGNSGRENAATWVHRIFEGTLTNETRCLGCDTVTNRDEQFLDLSLDVEQNTSLTGCLRNFSSTETLCGDDKFFCDRCCSLQEAQKSMKIKRLPQVLALHLKRFKYVDSLQRLKKLNYRVAFPFELKISNVSDDAIDPDRMYELFAVVIHVGSGPHHGHYVALIKAHSHWLIFDDDSVELIDESAVHSCFGSSQDMQQSTDAGYILFYQTVDEGAEAL